MVSTHIYDTKKEERKNKAIALLVTILTHAALLLFLILYIIITPLPPYRLLPTPEVEVEADFGNNINGTGHVEANNMGENTESGKVKSASSHVVSKQSAPVIRNEAEDVNIKTPEKTTITEKIDSSQSTQPQISMPLAGALNKFRNAKGQGAEGGDGNSGNAGNAGSPGGTNPGEGNGTGGPFNYFLKGRKIVARPNISSNTQDEGKVVVKILVDQAGNVIKATPGEKGSNTTNTVLYEKAKEAALSTKFSPSPDGTPEQQGSMTIIFTVQ